MFAFSVLYQNTLCESSRSYKHVQLVQLLRRKTFAKQIHLQPCLLGNSVVDVLLCFLCVLFTTTVTQ